MKNREKTLSKICKPFMQYMRSKKGRYDNTLEDKLHAIIRNLKGIHSEIISIDNMNFYDPSGGGFLRGDIVTRDNNELLSELQEFEGLLCSKEEIFREKGFQRAIFNSKIMTLKVDERTSKRIDFLSYESPIIRKKFAAYNPEIYSPFCRCDIVSIHDNQVLAIEIKADPEEYDTCLPYGIIEGLAYGYFFRQHLDTGHIDQINREIEFCSDYYNRKRPDKLDNDCDVSFYLAAPKDYFIKHLSPIKRSKRWCDFRIKEAKQLENFSNIILEYGIKFGGYIVVNNSISSISYKLIKSKNRYFPFFEEPDVKAVLFKSISDVLKDLDES